MEAKGGKRAHVRSKGKWRRCGGSSSQDAFDVGGSKGERASNQEREKAERNDLVLSDVPPLCSEMDVSERLLTACCAKRKRGEISMKCRR